jgi:hypothetical protein
MLRHHSERSVESPPRDGAASPAPVRKSAVRYNAVVSRPVRVIVLCAAAALAAFATVAFAMPWGLFSPVIVLIGGAAITWLLYLSDRPSELDRLRRQWRRRRGQCERCGYDLTGNEGGDCPECGYATPARRGGH